MAPYPWVCVIDVLEARGILVWGAQFANNPLKFWCDRNFGFAEFYEQAQIVGVAIEAIKRAAFLKTAPLVKKRWPLWKGPEEH